MYDPECYNPVAVNNRHKKNASGVGSTNMMLINFMSQGGGAKKIGLGMWHAGWWNGGHVLLFSCGYSVTQMECLKNESRGGKVKEKFRESQGLRDCGKKFDELSTCRQKEPGEYLSHDDS